MDRYTEKQDQISLRRTEFSAQYPARWSNMISEWNSSGPQDRAWLMYSANYLFRTNNLRWAIDPLTLTWRLKDAPRVNVVRDLACLSFVLLTHRHQDHLDTDLLFELRKLPITWIIPEFMLSEVVKQSCLPREKILVPSSLVPVKLNGVHILPFEGLHWESRPDGTGQGVPAMGYLIECNGRRWLFPGDTRCYDVAHLPRLGKADVVFAHLWLGRGCALADKPPLLESFCQFYIDLGGQIILTHLNEFGRDANDYWDEAHAQSVRSKIREMSVNFPVFHLVMGDSVRL